MACYLNLLICEPLGLCCELAISCPSHVLLSMAMHLGSCIDSNLGAPTYPPHVLSNACVVAACCSAKVRACTSAASICAAGPESEGEIVKMVHGAAPHPQQGHEKRQHPSEERAGCCCTVCFIGFSSPGAPK